jgi:hypothetical protein
MKSGAGSSDKFGGSDMAVAGGGSTAAGANPGSNPEPSTNCASAVEDVAFAAELDEALRDVSVLAEGNVPGGVVPFNEVRMLVEQLVELRKAARAVLTAMDKRTATEPAPQCFGAPFGELNKLRELVMP